MQRHGDATSINLSSVGLLTIPVYSTSHRNLNSWHRPNGLNRWDR